MTRVQVKPDMIRWARERARTNPDNLRKRFPKLLAWEAGEVQPTFKQLEDYATATFAPLGFLLLPEPPTEKLPLPDFRTIAGKAVQSPSPNLLDMLQACLERQDWYRDFATENGAEPLQFVGSASTASSVVEVADAIRTTLKFDLGARQECPTWTDALRLFIAQADVAGLLVMCSGVVGSNNRRALDPEEFRGFALVDPVAPLVFVNGADSKAGQMFTLAHELAHIWLGKSALDDATVASQGEGAIETWCNRVAAEVLAPLGVFKAQLHAGEELDQAVRRLARVFKVSTLVVIRRLWDAERINFAQFQHMHGAEVARIAAIPKKKGGGDFYLTTAARVSKRFARGVVESTLEGRTLYRDAFRMLGVSKTETFNELGRSLHFEA